MATRSTSSHAKRRRRRRQMPFTPKPHIKRLLLEEARRLAAQTSLQVTPQDALNSIVERYFAARTEELGKVLQP